MEVLYEWHVAATTHDSDQTASWVFELASLPRGVAIRPGEAVEHALRAPRTAPFAPKLASSTRIAASGCWLYLGFTRVSAEESPGRFERRSRTMNDNHEMLHDEPKPCPTYNPIVRL
jgi:hypothetical protein